jgi:general secretion pathway protein D
MREGEISILAGLTRNQASDSLNGLPGVIDIPVLGKWLGANHQERDRGDLMIALIPHIVRTPDFSPENLRGVFAGTDAQLRLMYNSREATGSAPVEPAAPAPVGAPPANAPSPAPAKPGAPAPGQARVTFNPATVSASANAPFTLNIQLENVADAASITPLRVSWDPALLRLNDIAPGDLMGRDGGRVTSVKDIRNDAGQASLMLTRAAGSSGVNGSGAAATLNFVALAPGVARVTVTEIGLKDTQNRAIEVSLGAIPVAIQ